MGDRFDDAVAAAVRLAVCPEHFAVEVLERLDAGRLSTLALATIVLESPAAGGWDVLRQALVNEIATCTHEADAVFSVATSALGLGALSRAVTGRSGPPHAPTFTVAVRVERSGRALQVTASAGSRRLAEQRAAVRLLATLVEVEPPPFSEGTLRARLTPLVATAGSCAREAEA